MHMEQRFTYSWKQLTNCPYIQITNDGEAPEKDAKEGGGLSALRKAVEAEKGSMKTIFEPVFCSAHAARLFKE